MINFMKTTGLAIGIAPWYPSPHLCLPVPRIWSSESARMASVPSSATVIGTWTAGVLHACVAAANAKPALRPVKQAFVIPKSCASRRAALLSKASRAGDRTGSPSQMNEAVRKSDPQPLPGTRRKAGFLFVRNVRDAQTLREHASSRHYSNDVALDGRWGGIRTHGTLSRTPVFKTGSLNHSDTHPSN